MAQLRIGVMLSWLTAWVLVLFLLWVNYVEQKDSTDLDRLKELSETQIAAGVIGLITSLVGAGILLSSKLTMSGNMVLNTGAWLGVAWAVFIFIRGYQSYQIFDGNETYLEPIKDKQYHLALAVTNFVLAVVFLITGVVSRTTSTFDRAMYSVVHLLSVLGVAAAFMLFCWEIYSTVECTKDALSIPPSKTLSECQDDRKAWLYIIMLVSYISAGVAVFAAVVGKFKDGIPLGTAAIGALFGAYISIQLSIAENDCQNDCPEDSYLSVATIGGIASAVVAIFFCLRAEPNA